VGAGPSPILEDVEDQEDGEADSRSVPRRTNFYASRTPWWRPRSNFGRILLGTGLFIVAALLVTAGIFTRKFLIRDPHFRIVGASSIQSTGLSEVNRADVLPVFGEDIGRNIFFVPLGERRKALEAIPWVKQATVMRFLPDQISVSLVERTPVAFIRQGQQVELADSEGVILSMSPAMMAQHHYSFPVVTGIDAKDSLAARKARMAVYLRFIAELDQNQQHLTEQVSEIDLSDPEDLRATMPEQGSDILAHFGEDQFLRRLHVYKSHIDEWRQRYPRMIGVDLRYSGEVPLEMASDGQGSGADKISPPSDASTKASTVKPETDAKQSPGQTSGAKVAVPALTANQRKALDAKKKAAKLKAAKAKTAHAKAMIHPAAHTTARTTVHATPSSKQGA
jgi:cell division protein FtsQ